MLHQPCLPASDGSGNEERRHLLSYGSDDGGEANGCKEAAGMLTVRMVKW